MRSTQLAAGLMLALAGCQSLRSGANPDQPLWVERPSGSIEVIYRTALVASSRRFGEAYERGRVEIDSAAGRLFVGSSDRGLYCLDAADGSALWRFETAGPVQSTPLYDGVEDALYFGSADGALYKVDARNGQLRYRFATNSEVSQRPVLAGNAVFAVNANDTVFALDKSSGKMLWNQHRTPAAGMQIAGHAGVRVWRDKVFVGYSDGSVAAYDPRTGAERWQPIDLTAEAEQSLGDTPEYFDVDTTPEPVWLESGPAILVASAQGGVFALDADNGTPIWSNPNVRGTTELLLFSQPAHPNRQGGPPLPARQLVIAATGVTGLWGLDPADGSELWRTRLPEGGVAGPVMISGALMVSTSQLGVFLISALDGRVIDGLHVTDGVSSLVGAKGTRAFLVTNEGNLMALHVPAPVQPGADASDAITVLGRPMQPHSHF